MWFSEDFLEVLNNNKSENFLFIREKTKLDLEDLVDSKRIPVPFGSLRGLEGLRLGRKTGSK